jgi:hypothetical protein
MPLENLTIRRASLHEVHRRADDRTIVAPTYATELFQLDPAGLQVFERRVLQAFQSDAKCMRMTISSHAAGSVAAIGTTLVAANDRHFVEQSKSFADLLAAAQTSRQYPGGLVVTFDGTVGHPARRFFGVMKAEMHEAFLKGENLQARFVDSVFLSPKTKLYKIGLFTAVDEPALALPEGWTATVYDSQLTAAARDGAALYFHETFLGLAFPENSAQQTKAFYQKTREFIAAAPIPEEEKVNLYNGLYSYLKLDRSPTVQVATFADQFMEENLGDDYRRHMRRERFPEEAIQKDISEIAGRMRVRKLRFGSQITLSGPAEAITDQVDISPIEGPDGEQWTQITVHSRLESQV